MKTTTVARLIRKYNVRPQKAYSQNFLADPQVADRLIDCLDVYPDEDVLEIGSGLGILSSRIAGQSLGVLGVEKDRRLFKIACKEFGQQKNLKFVEGDFLKLDLFYLLSDYHLPIKVIGNIPYAISSSILFKLLENKPLFQLAVLTVQKEVAQRMTAKAKTKDYGVLTILLQSQVVCEKMFDIAPGSFRPEPKVDSSVVKILFPKKDPYLIYKPVLFKKVVKTAFRQRRKKVRNTLKKLLKNNRINPWSACNIDPEVRPEEISVPQYVALANFLAPLL